MIKNLRNHFIKGLLLLLPVTLTLWLFWKFFWVLDSLLLRHIHNIIEWMGLPAFKILDVFILTACIILLGLLGGNFLGRRFITFINYVINKIPIFRVIYAAIQQILESVLGSNKSAFSKVALVEYPRKGLYSIAFITAETKGAVGEAVDEECWSVFLPTTPNPTSGFLLFVPKKDTIVLDITIDQAAKLIMSAGVISENQKLGDSQKIHIEKLGRMYKGAKKNKS
ncbi:MAG: DUF502 domain-containing protein [Fibrobacteria bacterium]|nr:DUF502 domain-containing protein [Fibrobacteria bacterium]